MPTGLCSLACLLLLFAACASGRALPYDRTVPVPATDGGVVTEVDLLAAGRTLVDDYVAAMPAAERECVAALDALAARVCVRIGVRTSFAGGHGQECGSGVLTVAPGADVPVVLSAAHVFPGTRDGATIHCWTTAGVALEASLAAPAEVPPLAERSRESWDWVELRLASPPGAGPWPRRAAPVAGSLVLAYGYPDRCGVDAAGRTVRGEAYEGAPLLPLRMVLRVIDDAPLELAPVAGAMPLGGFSGGGLFDLDGQVVGVLTGTKYELDRNAQHVLVTGTSAAAMR